MGTSLKEAYASLFQMLQPPTPTVPSSGASPDQSYAGAALPVAAVIAAGDCGGGASIAAAQVPAFLRGGSVKRAEPGPVVAVTSQTLPAGFKVGPLAFGIVAPEGR